MKRKINTIVPFLQDALDNNKYASYLMYTDKAVGEVRLILPRKSKNLKEEDMQLLKDWHAAQGGEFDYKNVKRLAVNALKCSEIVSKGNGEYTFRMLLPKEPEEPVEEFVPFEGNLIPLQKPVQYESSNATKISQFKTMSRIKHFYTYGKTHPNSKLRKVIASSIASRKYCRAAYRKTSTKRMLKMFENLAELQEVLESYLSAHLKVQSDIKQSLNLNNEAAGFPIHGILRSGENEEKWDEISPKIMIASKESFVHKEYPSLETLSASLPGLDEPVKGLFEFVNKFFQIDDETLQQLLNLKMNHVIVP